MIGHLAGLVVLVTVFATGHLLYKQSNWPPTMKSLLSGLLAAALVFVIGVMFGTHMCDQGAPVYTVSILSVCFGLAIIFLPRTRESRLLRIFLVLLTFGASIYLSGYYHHSQYTGNPKYSDSFLWHTPLTGIYPRGKAALDIR